MKKKCLVSVIIPTFNRLSFLGQDISNKDSSKEN